MNALEPSPATLLRIDRSPVQAVVQQHVDEAGHLRHVRSALVRAPHVRMLQLANIDERIAAHLDGIAVAGDYGTTLCHQALDPPASGPLFVATVRAIEERKPARLESLLAIAELMPDSRAGLLSAFGWLSAASMRGIAKPLLDARDSWRQQVGLVACAMHGVNPGVALDAALHDADNALRTCALRVAGKGGRVDRLDACRMAIGDHDPNVAFHAARSALLLGDRVAPIDALHRCAAQSGKKRDEALGLLLKLLPADRSHVLLKDLSRRSEALRDLVRGIGVAGDAHYVPWLVKQMDDPKLTRLAGESFSLITGLDLAHLHLDRKPPEDVASGPNDNPDDTDVAMDQDDGLPWPDPPKVAAWWHANAHRFQPGVRYFMGQTPTPAHCLSVLKTGFHRQRIAAALYLCLLVPGTPLFNTAAPAWRQKRLLAQAGT